MAIVAHSPFLPLGTENMSFDPSQDLHTVEYVRNPHFSFPAQPGEGDASLTPARASSMRLSPSPSPRRTGPQRKSASALPTFSFNVSDTTGLAGDNSDNRSAGQTHPTTPSRAGGHRRGASEFVGGSARYGTSELISTSPIKNAENTLSPDNGLATGSPARKRGHAHRRSAAVSGHDLASILQPRDINAAQSPPQTALDDRQSALAADSPAESASTQVSTALAQTSTPEVVAFATPEGRAVSRPRVVGFAESIEIIPRPLSVISSETESSTSTPTNHSVANSIASIFDFTSGSPVAKRSKPSPLQQESEVHAPSDTRSSLEMTRSLEREGHWLRDDTERPVSDSAANSPHRPMRGSKRAITFTSRNNLDRRSSEPSLALGMAPQSSASAISLQEPVQSHFVEHVDPVEPGLIFRRRSSVKKVRDWASSVMNRKEKASVRSRSSESSRERPFRDASEVPPVPSVTVSPSQEPDLEELFSHDPFGQSQPEDNQPSQHPRLDLSQISNFKPTFDDTDANYPVIDLDAALGSGTSSRDAKSPGLAGRRQLHSSRANRDFTFHSRTQSAPALTQVDYMKSGSPVQSPMADVFEEEEEEDEPPEVQQPVVLQGPVGRTVADQKQENKTGIQDHMAPEAEISSAQPYTTTMDGLGIQRTASNDILPNAASLPGRRPSVIEDTILEESSPIEIVQADEEPRASVLTKSSDSSDAPTVLGDHSATILNLPAPQASLMTPTTYAASTFSSPDFTRRQGSFETSRLGTSASSATDCRTMSSFADRPHDTRPSMDDVPSLTSSHSTMISTVPRGGTRRNFSERSVVTTSDSISSGQTERRRKRSSIQSLTKLVGSSFSDSKSRVNSEQRSQPSTTATGRGSTRKREHRLSRLMFWRDKTTARSGSQSQ